MKLKTLIFSVLTMAAASANAIVSQRVTLKDGSTLDGYIALQKPGEKIQFQADEYHVIMAKEEVKSISEKEVSYNDLSEAWTKWADDNNAWLGEGENRKLLLTDISTTEGKTIPGVRIVAKGSQIHFIGFTTRLFPLSWESVQSVTCERRKPTTLNGVNRIYTLKDGQTFEGQYVHEIPGEAIAICDETGMLQYFEADKVAKYSLTKINPEQNIYAQCDLIDVLVLKDNNRSVRGIIVERNYAEPKAADNYLLIQSENGFQEKIRFSQVNEYRKEPNKAYKPLEDILLNEGELCINRMKADSLSLTEEDDYLLLPNNPVGLEIIQDPKVTAVTIEFVQPKEGTQELKIMKVQTYQSAKKKDDPRYGFTYKDIAKTAISPKSSEVSVNKTCKQVFEITDSGYYVVYNNQLQIVYPFTVK